MMTPPLLVHQNMSLLAKCEIFAPTGTEFYTDVLPGQITSTPHNCIEGSMMCVGEKLDLPPKKANLTSTASRVNDVSPVDKMMFSRGFETHPF